MGTNPAVSLPRADAVRAAMARLDLLVVSENVLSNDTTSAGAHVLLPAAAWGEKDGTVTNSERRISRQRPFLPLPGEAGPTGGWCPKWRGGSASARRSPGQAGRDLPRARGAIGIRERRHAGLRSRGLAESSDAAIRRVAAVQWPIRRGDAAGQARLFADGGFFTPNRRARFVAIDAPRYRRARPRIR